MKKKFYMFVTVVLLMNMVTMTGCSLYKHSNTAVQNTVNEKMNTETIEGDDNDNTTKPVDDKTEAVNDNSTETESFNAEESDDKTEATNNNSAENESVNTENTEVGISDETESESVNDNKVEDNSKVEETKPEHQHNWVAQYSTVHHDAEYTTVHHDAEYTTVHHDAEYTTVHHDAEYTTVHHDAEYTTVHHDPVIINHPGEQYKYYCRGCGCGRNDLSCGHGDFYSPGPVISEGWLEVVSAAYDEQVLTKAAYDERVLVKDAYDEQVETKSAYDEQIETKPAYDEKVLVKDAYDEQVISGYTCSCGAKK